MTTREDPPMTSSTPIAPRRIQRRRTRGWTLAAETTNPAGAVIVSRPSRWGNPCRIGVMQEMGYEDPHAAAAGSYRAWLNGDRADAPTDEADLRRERILTDLHLLCGRDLACTCQLDQPCHADTLLLRANLPEPERAEWIARVRAWVDRQRTYCGLPPVAELAA